MKLRLDIWLHRARLFKSRTQATTACRESKIMIHDNFADAGDTVQEGDKIKIRSQGLYREYRVLEAADINLSKQEAKRMYEEITDPATVEKFRQVTESNREWRLASKKESGRRPTKKKRRDLDKARGR
jgi:ribosome-associated heat shock protein Hsp15